MRATEAILHSVAPDIPWREPIQVTIVGRDIMIGPRPFKLASKKGLGCRYCIGMKGLTYDSAVLYPTREQFDRHMDAEHALMEKSA